MPRLDCDGRQANGLSAYVPGHSPTREPSPHPKGNQSPRASTPTLTGWQRRADVGRGPEGRSSKGRGATGVHSARSSTKPCPV
ncbi:hypothetical protein GCM10029963_28350 [Micromonospora andamanensis]|nr:hypothetical protein Vwe01_18580 [Micromonospora andamanensis]